MGIDPVDPMYGQPQLQRMRIRIQYCYSLVMNALSHPYHLDATIFIFRDIGSNFSFFISFFDEIRVSKQKSPRFCLPMPHETDARLK